MTGPVSNSLAELEALVREFANARDWVQFHTPRNIVLALVGEVGELAALLQWVPDDDVFQWLQLSKNRSSFEGELADVFGYLLCLADRTNVDLGAVLKTKLLLNESRYPQEKSRGSSEKYTKYE